MRYLLFAIICLSFYFIGYKVGADQTTEYYKSEYDALEATTDSIKVQVDSIRIRQGLKKLE